MNNIYIFKGDSTTFADITKFLTFHIQTLLDLKGWKAQFILGSITKEVDNIESKSFEIVLTNAETSNLLYGQKNGIVKLFDEKGQVKTVTNTIPFEIGNKVSDNKHELINLTIPQTTEIEMVLEIGQQGEGGTSNYNDLFNKPKINGISLQGEKSLDDLEIQAKGNYATNEALQVVSEKQTSTDDEVNHLTGEMSDVKLKLPKKLEAVNILQGSNITLDKQGNNITINAQTGQSGTSDYTELTNKPQINNVELTGNKTLEELGIQPKGDYLTSIPKEYVTETELAQKGYATTSQLTNKLEATNIIQGNNITLDKVGNNITINSTGGSASGGQNAFSLFDYKLSDHIIKNLSWLLSTGQDNKKQDYPSMYEAIIQEQANPTTTGVSIKLSTESFTDYDYVLNTTNETFRLPLKVKIVNGGKTPVKSGKPHEFVKEITNNHVSFATGNNKPWYNLSSYSLCITGDTVNTSGMDIENKPTTGYSANMEFDNLYTETTNAGLYLYFYVGDTIKNADIVDVADIKATKADINLGNVTSNIDFVVETKSNSDGSWYRKYKNGWLEQGGIVKMGASGEVKTVTLLKPYANSNYTAIYQKTSTYAPSNGANDVVNTKTPTSFGVTCGEYQQLGMWYANGQGA